jgi:hypothetical protein
MCSVKESLSGTLFWNYSWENQGLACFWAMKELLIFWILGAGLTRFCIMIWPQTLGDQGDNVIFWIWKVSHRFMFWTLCPTAGGATSGSCRTFRRWGLAGRIGSLWMCSPFASCFPLSTSSSTHSTHHGVQHCLRTKPMALAGWDRNLSTMSHSKP